PQGVGFEIIIKLAMFSVIFYFMNYRPQSKRVKEHKNQMAAMAKGDEVLTSGGLVGRITKIAEETAYITIELNTNNEV
ncbi:preprotein translocase subunit YajC, partial [Vibrio cholerae]|uniref:preprotein translocase subunit YajC n=1 Tax=Vibrio cholerae TaxID=666 RepID=UPI0039C93F91